MTITFRPLSDHTGTEAIGIDLRRTPDAATRRALNAAFVEHSVLVVRDQNLSPHEMVTAVELLGDIFEQHNQRFQLPDCPQIHYISNQDHYPDGTRYIPGAGYHTDHSNDATPPKATVLHAVKLPDQGGDTQYVNMHAAYDGLSDTMKARLQGLRGRHVYQSRFSKRKLMNLPKGRAHEITTSVLHPLVRTHPESGRKALYINPIRIEAIDGMAETTALDLLGELLAHATQEKYQYRHNWRRGDLVFWDNRCLMHKANGDYDHSQERYLYRVMLKGDKPV